MRLDGSTRSRSKRSWRRSAPEPSRSPTRRRLPLLRPSGEAREAQEGWDAADGLEEGWVPTRLRELVLANVERAEPPPTYVSFGHYAMNSDGLVVEVTKGRGETASVEEIWCTRALR